MRNLRSGAKPVRMGRAFKYDETYVTASLKGKNNSSLISRLGKGLDVRV